MGGNQTKPGSDATAEFSSEGEEESAEKPVQLIRVSEDDSTFELCDDGVAILNKLVGREIAVVSVAGLYRTGKSFLLNAILNKFGKQGFSISPLTDACTRGIWMWGQPLPLQDFGFESSGYVLFLDTEGLASTDSNENKDAYIFALTILLSSVFVYNSMRVIDAQALDSLGMVTHLIRDIHKKSVEAMARPSQKKAAAKAAASSAVGTGLPASSRDLMFPSFFWVLRDFDLKLGGTADDYLEDALKSKADAKSDSEKERNVIRKTIKEMFQERHVVTMVRPVTEERQLQSLDRVQFEHLRPEFRSQLEYLRETIMNSMRMKQFGNVRVDGPMFVEFARVFCASISKGETPPVYSVYTSVVERQCRNAAEEIIEEINDGMLNVDGDEAVRLFQDRAGSVIDAREIAVSFEEKVRKVAEDAVRRIPDGLARVVSDLPKFADSNGFSPDLWRQDIARVVSSNRLAVNAVAKYILDCAHDSMVALKALFAQERDRLLAERDAQVQNWVHQVQSAQMLCANLNFEVQQLNTQLAQREAELNQANARFSQRDAELVQREAQIAELKNRSAKDSQHIMSDAREIERLQTDLHRVTSERKEAQTQAAGLNVQIAAVTAEATALKRRISELESTLESYRTASSVGTKRSASAANDDGPATSRRRTHSAAIAETRRGQQDDDDQDLDVDFPDADSSQFDIESDLQEREEGLGLSLSRVARSGPQNSRETFGGPGAADQRPSFILMKSRLDLKRSEDSRIQDVMDRYKKAPGKKKKDVEDEMWKLYKFHFAPK
eukprot:ANDGO_04520.mRNA.1 Atlastin